MLTSAQRTEFDREGFLVVKGLLDPERDLDPVIMEYEGVLDQLASELFEGGELKSRYEGEDFSERLIHVCRDTGRIHNQSFDFSLPQKNIKADTPMWTGRAIFDILRNERLLDAMESLIGPEIFSNPVQHVRLKLPEGRGVKDESGQMIEGATQWHQDNGVVLPEADATDMITVWFPLWDAPIESGCLQVIPGSHRQGVMDHCPIGVPGVGIPEKTLDMERAVALPMVRGDVLLLHRRMCHASLANRSQRVRWSFDLRYNPVGQPSGRDNFPGFIARSRKEPTREMRDYEQWAHSWHETRRKLASEPGGPVFNRWDGSAEVCA